MMAPYLEVGMDGDRVYFATEDRRVTSRRFRQEPIGPAECNGSQEMEITVCETGSVFASSTRSGQAESRRPYASSGSNPGRHLLCMKVAISRQNESGLCWLRRWRREIPYNGVECGILSMRLIVSVLSFS